MIEESRRGGSGNYLPLVLGDVLFISHRVLVLARRNMYSF